ncbi:hypothetical protein pb186bvf_014828 [Paramecium bursaria]
MHDHCNYKMALLLQLEDKSLLLYYTPELSYYKNLYI